MALSAGPRAGGAVISGWQFAYSGLSYDKDSYVNYYLLQED